MGPEFLSTIESRTALETPQIICKWSFAEVASLADVPWFWDSMKLQRSDYRYPEDETEGDNVLSESYFVDPSVAISDVSIDGMKEYYYSLFFQYTEYNTSNLNLDQVTHRLGSSLAAIYPDEKVVLVAATDGATQSGQPTVTSTGSTFWTSGVQAGFLLEIDEGGADDGFYRILSVDSETQVTLESNLSLTASNVDFNVYSDHDKFWIAGVDFHRKATLWRWDSKSSMVDKKIVLDDLLDLDEFVAAIAYVGTISSTQYIAFLTQKRYVRLPTPSDLVSTPDDEDVTNTWLLTNMPPNYEVVGAFLDLTVFAGADTVYVLDVVSKQIQLLAEADGSAGSVIDLSGLAEVSTYDALRGLAPDYDNSTILVGNRNYIYSFDSTASSPDSGDVDRIVYVRELLNADLGLYKDSLASIQYVCVVNDVVDRLRTYEVEVGRAHLWQQPYVPDEHTIGLYHLNESSGNFVDSSQYSNDGVNSGMSYEAEGQFGFGVEATGLAKSVDIVAIAGEFDGEEGSAEVWFKASSTDSIESGTSHLLYLRVDGSNYIRIYFVNGTLRFQYFAGGTSIVITGAHPSIDTEYHHYMITWSKTDDEVKGFFDFDQFGNTQNSLGTWTVNPLTSASIGYTSSSSLGMYDECRISDIPRTNSTRVQSYTDANKMHAFSGRDYEASYDEDDPLGFYYRDEFFTEKFMGGDYIIRNDYEAEPLYPQNKVIEDSEIIFRGPTPLPSLGHTGRLSRLLGLYLDRIADARERHLTVVDRYETDEESIPALVDYLGLPGLDTGWNVDKQRRFLRIMPMIKKRGGLAVSYDSYARLLGFLVEGDHLQAKRRFDSVHYNANFDAQVQAIPFDTMGSFDTFDDYFPLALLRWRIYQQSTKASSGSTSVAGNRILTDSSASFRTTCMPGNLIRINDPDDTDDNGVYVVTEVHSDTELKVDRDWLTGGLSNLTYTNNWEVPFPDPWTDYLLKRFEDHIAPDCMKIMHRDDAL